MEPLLAQCRPGTYVLVLYLHRERTIRIGKLGQIRFPPGTYAYVGSAFGPGGLRARLGRHLRKAKRPHWHIDYFREEAALKEVWLSGPDKQRECAWASVLLELNGARVPAPGFGSSDCACRSHLIYFETGPSWSVFEDRVRTRNPTGPPAIRIPFRSLREMPAIRACSPGILPGERRAPNPRYVIANSMRDLRNE